MSLTVCPTAVVAAPVEVVWANLVQWERYAEWADVYVERSFPPGWWGWFLERFGAKRIAAGVDESLQRLKRASERQHQQYQQAQAEGK